MADSSLLDAMDVSTLQRPPRSAGLHMSTLLRKLHPVKSKGDISEAQLALYGIIGLAFEDRCELALNALAAETDWPWTTLRPGEVQCDGVAGSPDILLVPKDGSPVRELSIKTTWKSCRRVPLEAGENEFPKEFDYYLAQCMAYSTAMDTPGSVLFCYFVCGNWVPPVPQVHAWELDFNAVEKSENWDALMTIASEEPHD